jgi:PAS domain-containing protein
MLFLSLLFVLSLFVLVFLWYLHRTYEGFQQAADGNSLASNPDATAFFAFHGQVCDVWNQVIDAAMKSDQTTESKEDYLQALEAKQTPPASFLRCETALTANMDLQTLVNSIPDVSIYQNSLTFLNQEIQKILKQTEAALQGVSQEPFVDLPAAFQAPFDCQQQGATLQCTTQLQQVQPSGGTAAVATLLQQVLLQLQPITAALPTLQASLQVAQEGLQKLNAYKEKAQSGEIYNEVKVPGN